jgi:hypothetical protein
VAVITTQDDGRRVIPLHDTGSGAPGWPFRSG